MCSLTIECVLLPKPYGREDCDSKDRVPSSKDKVPSGKDRMSSSKDRMPSSKDRHYEREDCDSNVRQVRRTLSLNQTLN